MPKFKKSFTTERLQLNLIHQANSEFILKLVNTAGWIQFIGDRNVHSVDDAKSYIAKLLNTKHLSYWIISTKHEPEPLGIISLIKRDYLDHFDIGFALLPEFQGKGYAYEGARAIMDYAKNILLHKTILATTLPTNINSIKVLQKLNFSFLKEIQHNHQNLHIFTN